MVALPLEGAIMSRGGIAVDDRALDALAGARSLPLEHFESVCRLAAAVFQTEKQSRKRLSRTAEACGWEPKQLENAVLGIAKILMDAVQADLDELAIRTLMSNLELSSDHVESITKIYVANKEIIRSSVSREMVLTVPRYRNMEWRIDLEIATRFLRNKPKPIVTLCFDTLAPPNGSGLPTASTTYARVDYEGLRLLQRRLEQALSEVDSVHCSRIQRYMH